jgi:hypothetical protein
MTIITMTLRLQCHREWFLCDYWIPIIALYRFERERERDTLLVVTADLQVSG